MVKLKNITIINFQSIKNVTIHFNENGAYHIKGKHNIGKSVIVKAINTLFNNASRFKYSSFLRDECSTFVIKAEFFDGGKVTLSRGAIDFYEWDIPQGKGLLEKTDGKVPVELMEYFNLYNIYGKNNTTIKESLNIRVPRSKLLFVDTTVAENYSYFQKAMRTEHFLTASKLAKTEKRDITSRKKVETERLEKFTQIKEVTERKYQLEKEKISKIEAQYKIVESEANVLEKLQNTLYITDDVVALSIEIKELSNLNKNTEITSIDAVFEKLNDIPLMIDEIVAITQYISILRELRSIQDERKNIESMLQLLAESKVEDELLILEKCSSYIKNENYLSNIVASIKENEKVVFDFEELTNHYTLYNRTTSHLVEITTVDMLQAEIKDMADFEKDYTELGELNKTVSQLNKYLTAYTEAKETQHEIKQLTDFIANYELTKKEHFDMETAKAVIPFFNEIGMLQNEIEVAKDNYIKADTEFTDFMKEHNYCPIVEMTLNKQCPFS